MSLTIRGKLLLGFGVILMLMIVMGGFNFITFTNNSEGMNEVVDNTEMKVMILERLEEHLVWLNELGNSFITGDSFTGELDHTMCNFGQWYYEFRDSEEYDHTSDDFRRVFEQIEEPHRLLHESTHELIPLLEAAEAAEEEEGYFEDALEIYQN